MLNPTVSSGVGYPNLVSSTTTANYKTEKVTQDFSIQSTFPAGIENLKNERELSPEEINKHADEMNQMMSALNTDMRFSLHEKTKQLMVQMINLKTNEVVKEFPPHEFLDTIGKIRDFVGLILDKKA